MGAHILSECNNARELKANLDYYLEKYECLASQSSVKKHFHGKAYLTTQESARRVVANIKTIIAFMQWEDDKTFVNSMQWSAEKMSY